MKYLTTFFEKIDQANIITAADVHKAKMLRLAKLKGTNVASAVRNPSSTASSSTTTRNT